MKLKGVMKLKELRTISANDLRMLCIKKSWYTLGNNEEYDKLLNSVRDMGNVTTENIVYIATDILEHSEDTGYDLQAMCFEVARICNTLFY